VSSKRKAPKERNTELKKRKTVVSETPQQQEIAGVASTSTFNASSTVSSNDTVYSSTTTKTTSAPISCDENYDHTFSDDSMARTEVSSFENLKGCFDIILPCKF